MTAERLLDQSGISHEIAFDPDGEVTLDAMKAFWEAAYRETANPYLAIDAGIRAAHGSYKTLDYLFLAATTPGDGVRRYIEHFRLINTWLNFTLIEDSEGHHVVLESKIGPVPFAAVEITFAVLVERFRKKLGSEWAPLSVEFLHEPKGDPSYYHGFFRTKVRFAAAQARLSFDKQGWDAPIASGDQGLFDVLSDHAQNLTKQRPQPDDLVTRAQHQIMRSLGNGEPEIEDVAQALSVSTRTLQRRLAQRDVTYLQIVDQVREDQARNLVASGSMSISEVAFFLGYSDQSALTRAFKRWTGLTPRKFRLAQGQ
ncbi:AraC family transcriptional regulator [Sulfitobacter aestuariivivens]|uniref:AraC family transcriptional regulator n=1 Tax=Sulfitobacter aestuariivivens TaxID=2766981 RepID=UPI003616F942